MKSKKINLLMLSLFLSVGVSKAQEAAVSSGGDATGVGGSFSYSLGQISYTEISGSTGSLVQGVQHPIEILTVGANDLADINLKLNAYPNPTNNFLILSSDKDEFFDFELVNVEGKLIHNSRFKINKKIDMESYPI
jgi:hypothetical protein